MKLKMGKKGLNKLGIVLCMALTLLFSQLTFGKDVLAKSLNNFSADSLETKIDSTAIQTLRETGVPSASVAVVLKGKIVYAQGHVV